MRMFGRDILEEIERVNFVTGHCRRVRMVGSMFWLSKTLQTRSFMGNKLPIPY